MSWAKFKLLLNKNIKIQKRHPIGGFFEILFPICLSIVLAYVRDVSEPTTDPEIIFYEFQPMRFEDCKWVEWQLGNWDIKKKKNRNPVCWIFLKVARQQHKLCLFPSQQFGSNYTYAKRHPSRIWNSTTFQFWEAKWVSNEPNRLHRWYRLRQWNGCEIT